MPLNPASFPADEPPTAKLLNTALYTYTPGSNFTPTGILFHANRPMLVENLRLVLSQFSSTSGTTSSLTGSGNWKNYFDNGALFHGGADTSYDTANGTFNSRVPGSSGVAGSDGGGHFIIFGFPCIGATTVARGFGAYLNVDGTLVSGGKQMSSPTYDNCSYALDLVSTIFGQATSLEGWCADTSGGTYSYRLNSTDYSGETTRFSGFWCGVLSNGSTVSSVPVIPTWTSVSTVTSVALNGSAIGSPLMLLNNPPILRAGYNLSGDTVPANTIEPVALDTVAQVDTYSSWNGLGTYIVPISGVYLVHGYVYYSSSTTGNVYAIIYINSSTAIYGPAYQTVSGANFGPQITRLLDLEAGDIVQLATYSNTTNTYGNDLCRLVMVWMSGLASSNGSESFTPPNTGYRWQAGTSYAALTSAFQTHLTNDVSFLIQRPYLLAYQNTAQTGLSQDAFHTITMDTVSGMVHGSAGDPYGGWHTSSGGFYAAPVDGWYLVIAGFAQSALSSGTASCLAGVLQAPAGSTSPDWYQHVSTTTTGANPGAEAVGAYYLRAGDSVQPQYQQQDGGSTFSTAVTAGHQSSFGVIWLSE